jgi:hypothetical protein
MNIKQQPINCQNVCLVQYIKGIISKKKDKTNLKKEWRKILPRFVPSLSWFDSALFQLTLCNLHFYIVEILRV